jgi:hypothetical protein
VTADITVHHGDCLDVMAEMPDTSVDAIVTDPPYGLGFMGREWDDLPPGEEWARECLRVLKPGGHLLAFGGSRTWHRLAVAVEDAGFEVRDSIAWLYGSGFPKSLDVSKAIDKAAGATREVVGQYVSPEGTTGRSNHVDRIGTSTWIGGLPDITSPATPAAQQWAGWGTALKPAFEPIVVARKPLVGTVAANVLAHGTGALNIDATRVHTPGSEAKAYTVKRLKPGATLNKTGGNWRPEDDDAVTYEGQTTAGRWPTNVVLDGDAADELDRQDSGGASRFFPTFRYQAKAPTRERVKVDGVAHSTVKPLELIRWLVRLVTPPDGTVLDPFAGSGTTGEACLLEGLPCILIEREVDYLPLIHKRIARQRDRPRPLSLFDLDEEP